MNIVKKYLNKNERTRINSEFKNIRKYHNRYFSTTRFTLVKFKYYFLIVLSYIFSFVFFVFVSSLITGFISTQSNKLDSEVLTTLTMTMLGVSFSALTGIVVAIVFSLGTSDEYFNRREIFLFLDISHFKIISNLFLCINAIYTFTIGVICIFVNKYSDSLSYFFFTTLVTIYLFVRYLFYITKNKYDRFFYYLKHAGFYHEISKKELMADYITIISLAYNNDDIDTSLVNKTVQIRVSYFFAFLEQIKKSTEREENVIKEQNIFEDFFLKYSLEIETPIQLFALLLITNDYIELLKKNNRGGLTKNSNLSLNNIVKIFDNSLNSPLISFSAKSFGVDNLPPIAVLFPDFRDVVMDKLKTIILVQSFCFSCFTSMMKGIEQCCTDQSIDENTLTLFYKTKEKLLKISSTPINTSDKIKLLVENFAKVVDDLKSLSE